jgi:hypothetical protein
MSDGDRRAFSVLSVSSLDFQQHARVPTCPVGRQIHAQGIGAAQKMATCGKVRIKSASDLSFSWRRMNVVFMFFNRFIVSARWRTGFSTFLSGLLALR